MTLDEVKVTFGDEAERQALHRWQADSSNEDLRWEYLIIRDNNKKMRVIKTVKRIANRKEFLINL